jgi:hypothetical protein
MSGTSAPTPRERRWLQYSLRTLLVLILTAVFFLAICAVGLYGSVRCACDRS